MSNYSINRLTQPNYGALQDNMKFDFTNSVDNFNLQNQYQGGSANFPDIQTGAGFDATTDNFGQRNFSSRPGGINNNVNDTNKGLLDINKLDAANGIPTKPGMFGKPGGFGSGQGLLSGMGFKNIGSATFDENEFELDEGGQPVIGEDGQPVKNAGFGDQLTEGKGFFGKEGGFMSKFGTGQGALANMDWGAAGQAIGSGLQNMGRNMGQGFQYGSYGGGR